MGNTVVMGNFVSCVFRTRFVKKSGGAIAPAPYSYAAALCLFLLSLSLPLVTTLSIQ